MIRVGFIVAVVLGGLVTAAQARIADVVCDQQSRMKGKLERQYGAELRGRGLRGPDVVLEVWSSDRTGNWVLVQTYVDGRSCIVAMGDDWETVALPENPA